MINDGEHTLYYDIGEAHLRALDYFMHMLKATRRECPTPPGRYRRRLLEVTIRRFQRPKAHIRDMIYNINYFNIAGAIRLKVLQAAFDTALRDHVRLYYYILYARCDQFDIVPWLGCWLVYYIIIDMLNDASDYTTLFQIFTSLVAFHGRYSLNARRTLVIMIYGRLNFYMMSCGV